jgi:hypothetical protein
MGDITLKYGTDAAFTMTGIEDVDSSTTWVAGWTTSSVDNTSVNAIDYLVSGQFTLESSNRSTGTSYIYIYAYAAFTDTPTWPDLFSSGIEGSVGAAAVHDTEERDSGMRLVAAIACDDSASAVYTFPPTSIAQVFGGSVPAYWALWVTSNACTTTADWCVSSGTTLYYAPILAQYT